MTRTHLLHTARHQPALLGVHPLIHQTPPVATPRRLTLGIQPLVRAEIPRAVEVDAVVQTDHHADLGPLLHGDHVAVGVDLQRAQLRDDVLVHALHALERLLVHGLQLADDLGRDAELAAAALGVRLGRRAVPPQLVHARDGADEVRVAHVREGAEVRLVAAGVADAAARLDPLARLLGVRVRAVVVEDVDALGEEGAVLAAEEVLLVDVLGHHAVGHGRAVFDLLLAAGAFAHEGEGGGEDGLATLSRLHRACAETPALADMLHVIDDGDIGIAVQDKVAVHAMHGEVVRDGSLRGRQALRDGGAAIDACSDVSRNGREHHCGSMWEVANQRQSEQWCGVVAVAFLRRRLQSSLGLWVASIRSQRSQQCSTFMNELAPDVENETTAAHRANSDRREGGCRHRKLQQSTPTAQTDTDFSSPIDQVTTRLEHPADATAAACW